MNKSKLILVLVALSFTQIGAGNRGNGLPSDILPININVPYNVTYQMPKLGIFTAVSVYVIGVDSFAQKKFLIVKRLDSGMINRDRQRGFIALDSVVSILPVGEITIAEGAGSSKKRVR